MHFILMTMGQLAHLDARLFRRLFKLGELSPVRNLMVLFTRSADTYAYLIMFGIVWPVFGGDLRFLPVLAVGFMLELPAYKVIKSYTKRLRPCERLLVKERIPFPDKYSFPSGHTTAAVMVACLLGMHFPIFWAPMLIWAGLVGLSRIALGVHYPADVGAGAILGAVCALLANWLAGPLVGF